MSKGKLFNKAGKDYGVSGPFGIRNIPSLGLYNNYHIGVDYPFPQGTQLTLPSDTEVLKAYTGGDYGGQVFAYDSNTGYTYHLAHMSEIHVKVGQKVKAGSVVGLSGGAKGTWGAGLSTGPHLHFGVAKGKKTDTLKGKMGDGTWVNPESFDYTPKKTTTTTSKVKVGDKVKITGSKYATGQNIPDWVKKNTHTVQEISGNKALLKEIYSWVFLSDIGGSAVSKAVLKVGSKVKITGSKYATGQNIPGWVKKNTHTVQEISGDRVLLKEIYSWIYKKDITLL